MGKLTGMARWESARDPLADRGRLLGAPASGIESVVESAAVMGTLRGVTDAAADVTECRCPDDCERDHANE